MYFLDSSHVWHVAKTGNDGNGGHAQQYPVAFAADAKLTVAAAITAAAAGDTIIVWPGTYSENVNVSKSLNLIGTHPSLCKVDDIIISANNCYLEYITVEATSGPDAFTINGADDVTLYRCRMITTGIDGLIFGSGSERIRIIECYIKSGYDGLQLNNAKDVLIERCVLESTGANGSAVKARALSTQAGCENIIVRDSILIATTTQGVPVHVANCEDNNISFYNCTFYGTASVRTGEKEVVGLNAKAASGHKVNVLLVNCVFNITKGSPNYMILADNGGTVMAINCKGKFESPPAAGTETVTSSCTAQVSGQEKSQFKDSALSFFDDDEFIGYLLTWNTGNNSGESKYVTDWINSDTRYEFGSNFTNDIEVGDEYTATFINHTGFADTPNKGVLQASRISASYGTMDDSVTQLDEQSANTALENARLDQAAKLLLNKAVQDKATGAIQYYDDDGQTVILTHTPTDSQSQVTRTPN